MLIRSSMFSGIASINIKKQGILCSIQGTIIHSFHTLLSFVDHINFVVVGHRVTEGRSDKRAEHKYYELWLPTEYVNVNSRGFVAYGRVHKSWFFQRLCRIIMIEILESLSLKKWPEKLVLKQEYPKITNSKVCKIQSFQNQPRVPCLESLDCFWIFGTHLPIAPSHPSID